MGLDLDTIYRYSATSYHLYYKYCLGRQKLFKRGLQINSFFQLWRVLGQRRSVIYTFLTYLKPLYNINVFLIAGSLIF